jgi:hypothetical protein
VTVATTPSGVKTRRQLFVRARLVRHNAHVVSVRGMPWGIVLFLVYAFLLLAGAALALGPVVERAILIPITFEGLVLMALLAYTIFTITLVLQRKEAARGLSLGLVSLTVPAIPLALLWGQVILAVLLVALGLLLYRGLRAPRTRGWLDQP